MVQTMLQLWTHLFTLPAPRPVPLCAKRVLVFIAFFPSCPVGLDFAPLGWDF